MTRSARARPACRLSSYRQRGAPYDGRRHEAVRRRAIAVNGKAASGHWPFHCQILYHASTGVILDMEYDIERRADPIAVQPTWRRASSSEL
ncbi:MAG: multicopper oxidase domain-containing protein [Alphaproteobacteria bacterium]|nr:multicopper oxidase domain-containing protein [Alphaproteobacteria bacterium]